LSYDIHVVGVDKIKSALRSVEQGVRAHNARLQGEINRNVNARTRGATTEERSAKERARTEAQLARDKARAQAAEDRAQARARAAQQRNKRELAAGAIAAQNRAVIEERAANRAAEARKRAEIIAQRAERHRAASHENYEASKRRLALRDELHTHRMADVERRRAQQLEAAKDRGMRRAALLQAKADAAAQDRLGKLTGRAERATRTVRAIGGAAVGAVAIGGGVLLASGLATETAERAEASKLANQAGNPAMKERILNTARGVQGFTGAEAMAGLGSFMDLTGDAETGLAILNELGAVALATSTDLGELGAAAGNAFIPLNDSIKDPAEKLKAMQGIIRSMAGMGAVGAVEIKDLAAEMAGLAAQATKFEGGPQQAMTTALAMAQASRQRGGSSSAAEAVTSVERFGSDVLTKQAELRAMGVEVFANKERTQMRSQQDIVQDVLAKSGGDLGKLGAVFGERSIRAIQGFSPLYVAAEAQAEEQRKAGNVNAPKKGEAGRAAVAAEFQRLEQATLSDRQVRERADSRMSDTDMQWKEAMKKLNAAVGKDLLPALTAIIPELAKLAPLVGQVASALGSFVKFTSENPWSGIGIIVGGAIAKDIALAGIGEVLKNAVLRMFAGQAAASVAASAASGGAAAAGGAGAAGAAGGAAAGGGLALAGAVGAAAIGTGLAAWQVGKLGQETQDITGQEWGLSDYVNPLSWGTAIGGGLASGAVARRDEESQRLQQAKQELYRLQGLDAFGNPLPQVDVMNAAQPGAPPGAAPAPAMVQPGGTTAAAGAPLDTSKLDQAAGDLSRSAQDISRAVSGGLNRGNTPSPVKG
jgi:hypothetical protein